jgi:CubicO group peptidase (beta-lactamase class C family)
MIPVLSLVLLLCLHVAPPPVRAQEYSERLDALFLPLVTEGSPGFAVGIIRDGKLSLSRAYGIANLETGAPITTATNFRLASLTKQFTATAVMLLVHDGKIRYDEPITEVFSEFPEYGRNITIRHLLNHTSGLRDYEDIYAEQMGGNPPDPVPQITDAGVLRLLAQQAATVFPPGSRWRYSNSGYALLAMAVERLSGMPFQDFLRDRIFRPLQMDHTVAFVPGRNRVPNRAFGYRKEKDAWVFSDQSPTSAVLGDGGVYSSIDDLARWVHSLDLHTLLSAGEMRPAFTPVAAPGVESPDHTKAAYGFGWFLDPYKGHRRTWHYGETCGFLTALQRFPDERITVIVLSNRIDTDPTPLALKISDMYLETR